MYQELEKKKKRKKKTLAVYSLPNVRYIFTEIIQEHLSKNTTEIVTYEKTLFYIKVCVIQNFIWSTLEMRNDSYMVNTKFCYRINLRSRYSRPPMLKQKQTMICYLKRLVVKHGQNKTTSCKCGT